MQRFACCKNRARPFMRSRSKHALLQNHHSCLVLDFPAQQPHGHGGRFGYIRARRGGVESEQRNSGKQRVGESHLALLAEEGDWIPGSSSNRAGQFVQRAFPGGKSRAEHID
jgi:hypothetical protein